MGFSYDKLWRLTGELGISKTQLRDNCSFSSSTLSKLSKNENVSMDILERICIYLDCSIGDIVEVLPQAIKPKPTNSLKFIDLFAGIGGFRLAGETNGMECVFSSEIDKQACEVYKQNFGDMPNGDITEIPAGEIPNFDILFAGFPCQPFSYAGQLQGFEDETRGTLFFDILRILKEKQPQAFLLENVKGLKSHARGNTMRTVLHHLEELEYTVHWTILNSLNFGVPQSRERWYCVGFKNEADFSFPEELNTKPILREIIDESQNDNPTLRLSDFELERIKHHFSISPAELSNQLRVRHDNSKYEPHTKKGKYGIYSFLKSDKTLRFHVGDYAKTQIQEAYYCHQDSYTPSIIAARAPKLWDLERHLSDRECARLQGFPESFALSSSPAQTRKQMGNAVTVPVVTRIAEEILLAV